MAAEAHCSDKLNKIGERVQSYMFIRVELGSEGSNGEKWLHMQSRHEVHVAVKSE